MFMYENMKLPVWLDVLSVQINQCDIKLLLLLLTDFTLASIERSRFQNARENGEILTFETGSCCVNMLSS